ncbi:MAG: esterase [Rubrivivax sp.]|nr:esterase [Rubrivivax sp.]
MPLPVEWLPASGAPEQLILLLHGWRGDASHMLPLAQALRGAFPQAAILAPDGPSPGDGTTPQRARGRQWYAVTGLVFDDAGMKLWAERVQACVPGLVHWVRAQQRRLNVGAAATALAGFSQGGIISMAAALATDGLAGRVLGFGARCLQRPLEAPQRTTFHLFHGGADEVIAAQGSRDAFRWLADLQGDATIDIAEGVGHELHPALIECALHRLTHHIPMRTWREALGAVPAN